MSGTWHTLLETVVQASPGSKRVLGNLFHFLPPDPEVDLGGGWVCRTNMEPLSCAQGHNLPPIPWKTGESKGASGLPFKAVSQVDAALGVTSAPRLVNL